MKKVLVFALIMAICSPLFAQKGRKSSGEKKERTYTPHPREHHDRQPKEKKEREYHPRGSYKKK